MISWCRFLYVYLWLLGICDILFLNSKQNNNIHNIVLYFYQAMIETLKNDVADSISRSRELMHKANQTMEQGVTGNLIVVRPS